MVVYSFRIGPYARSIYLYGSGSFSTTPAEYHQPVKEYAARTFTPYQIDQALEQGFITQQEYDETILLMPTQA